MGQIVYVIVDTIVVAIEFGQHLLLPANAYRRYFALPEVVCGIKGGKTMCFLKVV